MVLLEWTGSVVLTTPRLLLRSFRRDDLPHYATLNADPEVMRYLGGALTRAASDQLAAWAQERHAREGTGLLAIERRVDGAFVGMCGLHVLHDWYPNDIEIGWRMARAYWGQGYATEAASAWLEHGFATLGLPRVISVTDPPNTRSLAVMHRLGMVLDHYADLEYEGETFQAVIHAITADQWRTRSGRPACTCAAAGTG
jgi:RimJ/RimL family protein N-acetyltransferase